MLRARARCGHTLTGRSPRTLSFECVGLQYPWSWNHRLKGSCKCPIAVGDEVFPAACGGRRVFSEGSRPLTERDEEESAKRSLNAVDYKSCWLQSFRRHISMLTKFPPFSF